MSVIYKRPIEVLKKNSKNRFSMYGKPTGELLSREVVQYEFDAYEILGGSYLMHY